MSEETEALAKRVHHLEKVMRKLLQELAKNDPELVIRVMDGSKGTN